MLPEKGKQAAGGFHGSPGDFVDAFEEKGQPCLPVAILAHGLEEFVVAGAVLLEIEGEVEQGVAEHAFGVEQKGNEQAPQPSVSVQKRVDRFELHMGERGFDENGGGDGLVV